MPADHFSDDLVEQSIGRGLLQHPHVRAVRDGRYLRRRCSLQHREGPLQAVPAAPRHHDLRHVRRVPHGGRGPGNVGNVERSERRGAVAGLAEGDAEEGTRLRQMLSQGTMSQAPVRAGERQRRREAYLPAGPVELQIDRHDPRARPALDLHRPALEQYRARSFRQAWLRVSGQRDAVSPSESPSRWD